MVMIEVSLLSQNHPLTTDQVESYRENGFIQLKKVLTEEVLDYFNGVISEVVMSESAATKPMEARSTYGKAFLQHFNLWPKDERVRYLVFSRRLASIAAQLMEVDGVRLYHDQALFKEPGGGITPWHADQYYWPLESDRTITAWIPLQEVSLEMGPLEFSAGSQAIVEGRELEISDESETQISRRLRVTDFKHVVSPFDLGDVSFHSGWIFHRAGANTTDKMRKVMTIIYMDKDMKLKEPENDGQRNDWKTWCPRAKVGEVIDTPLNPILT